jgi:serine/threonine protein kinase
MSKTEGWDPKGSVSDEAPVKKPETPTTATPSGPGTAVWGETEADKSPVPVPSAVELAEAATRVSDQKKERPANLVGGLVGQHLKHFRIDKRIAAGGMGEVYLGFDTSLSRPVAIKTIRAELARDATFLARFALRA